ncbi:N-6 DNA methylase [Christensenella sp. MSJ-20]|uniref:N-6 DNA methylase n=1 Tax=Christensenella sp. MSJ-20 TaxID=2841518 RepID=UPI001C7873BE|nr:N-6 DNA methylase [Christensenella sp. MSJ-20]
MDETQDDFSAAEAVECIPNTNPFLKHLMKECLGAENTGKLSFDELEIGNVVDLLKHTKTDAIIADFNRQTGGGREDPVIHFYEEFLTAYDKMQKVQRGVYYTPQPVVNFIVRAVDTIIKKDFGLDDGLASTETKTIKVMRQSKRRVGYYYTQVEDTEEVPAVQVLDPATGTGTFIRQTILQIYENFKEKNKGLSPDDLKKVWNAYVPEHLLPRINAFELMMAPYASLLH